MANKNGALRAGELELIGRYTRSAPEPENIYAFSVVLCDNEIDRDFERFSPASLEKLSELFVGVTGVLDHDARSENQRARIFSCSVEKTDRCTSDGLPYVRLTARAYTPINDDTRAFIDAVESGIKKEVSVGCSVKKRICSICGGDSGVCGHIRGRKYKEKLCYATLEEPTDAYEWSFVAVPAQKCAGVIKSYHKRSEDVDIEKRIFDGTAQSFTADEMNVLADRLRTLAEKAADGEAYRKMLEARLSRAAASALPELSRETLDFVSKRLDAKRLSELCEALEKRTQTAIPLKRQFGAAAAAENGKNNIYKEI